MRRTKLFTEVFPWRVLYTQNSEESAATLLKRDYDTSDLLSTLRKFSEHFF